MGPWLLAVHRDPVDWSARQMCSICIRSVTKKEGKEGCVCVCVREREREGERERERELSLIHI